MTIDELRKHPEYAKAWEKILGYRPGFKFTMNYLTIPTAKGNTLKIILRDACKEGYLISESIGLGFVGDDLKPIEETYRRTEKEG